MSLCSLSTLRVSSACWLGRQKVATRGQDCWLGGVQRLSHRSVKLAECMEQNHGLQPEHGCFAAQGLPNLPVSCSRQTGNRPHTPTVTGTPKTVRLAALRRCLLLGRTEIPPERRQLPTASISTFSISGVQLARRDVLQQKDPISSGSLSSLAEIKVIHPPLPF